MKAWLKNDIEKYSTHSEGKSLLKLLLELKRTKFISMTLISKHVYTDKLDIVKKYNNTYQNN